VADAKTPGPHAAWAFFVDFDGTITDVDGFDALVHHFKGAEAWDAGERNLASGRESLRDALARQTSYIGGTFGDVYAVHERIVGIEPSFAPFVGRCESAGIPVRIVSSGIAPLIEARLAAIGLEHLPVIAADVDVHPVAWTMRFRDESRNGTDKAAHIRDMQARGIRVAFAGDGMSDFDAALVADRRYAKRGRALETFLRERGIAFVPFSSFDEIAVPLPPTD
jgi:HAD superfamily phosphoserine phosphatase-like hydrolase